MDLDVRCRELGDSMRRSVFVGRSHGASSPSCSRWSGWRRHRRSTGINCILAALLAALFQNGCDWSVQAKTTLVVHTWVDAQASTTWDACAAALSGAGITLPPAAKDGHEVDFALDDKPLTLSLRWLPEEGVTQVAIAEDWNYGDTDAKAALRLVVEELTRRGITTKSPPQPGETTK